MKSEEEIQTKIEELYRITGNGTLMLQKANKSGTRKDKEQIRYDLTKLMAQINALHWVLESPQPDETA